MNGCIQTHNYHTQMPKLLIHIETVKKSDCNVTVHLIIVTIL